MTAVANASGAPTGKTWCPREKTDMSRYSCPRYVRQVAPGSNEERLKDALLKRVEDAVDAAAEIVADPEVLARVSVVRSGTGLITRCAWCGRYGVGDRWFVVDPKPQGLENKTTHGICDDCVAVLREAGMSV
jgi:hypothetical protein